MKRAHGSLRSPFARSEAPPFGRRLPALAFDSTTPPRIRAVRRESRFLPHPLGREAVSSADQGEGRAAVLNLEE